MPDSELHGPCVEEPRTRAVWHVHEGGQPCPGTFETEEGERLDAPPTEPFHLVRYGNAYGKHLAWPNQEWIFLFSAPLHPQASALDVQIAPPLQGLEVRGVGPRLVVTGHSEPNLPYTIEIRNTMRDA